MVILCGDDIVVEAVRALCLPGDEQGPGAEAAGVSDEGAPLHQPPPPSRPRNHRAPWRADWAARTRARSAHAS